MCKYVVLFLVVSLSMNFADAFESKLKMNKQKATRKHVQGEDYVGRCPSNIYFEGSEGKEYGWTNEKMKNEELHNDQQVEVKV